MTGTTLASKHLSTAASNGKSSIYGDLRQWKKKSISKQDNDHRLPVGLNSDSGSSRPTPGEYLNGNGLNVSGANSLDKFATLQEYDPI
jgi:hypothetical protein